MISKRIAAVAFFFAVFRLCKQLQVSGWVPIRTFGQRIFIEVENRSFASQLGSTLNRMIKEEFARSGAYQVTNEPSNAQLLAKVIIENYDRTAQAYQSDDTLLASGFELRLQTRVEIRKKEKCQAQFFCFGIPWLCHAIQFIGTAEGSASIERYRQ